MKQLTKAASFILFIYFLIFAPVTSQGSSLIKYPLPPHIKFQSNHIKILEYQSSCALSENQALVHQEGGKEYVFKGRLGLAPEWVHRPFNKEEQDWISACLMARTNFFGVVVPVLLKGEHPNLRSKVSSKTNNQNHILEEGAFYGNLFDQNSGSYVCSGRDIEVDNDVFQKRICALPNKIYQKNKCGFVYMGPCQEVCHKQNAESGAYSQCQDLKGKYHDEVITTYLDESLSED